MVRLKKKYFDYFFRINRLTVCIILNKIVPKQKYFQRNIFNYVSVPV